MRAVFFSAWRKHRDRAPLEGIETLVVEIALRHPEYHALLEQPEQHQDRTGAPEPGQSNPFLHMGLHIALHEQLAIDQPPGVRDLYRRIRLHSADDHAAEHRAMDCLAEVLWQAQRDTREPAAAAYLECLQRRAATPASR